MHFLIVEDDDNLAMTLRAGLEELNYEVSRAATAPEGEALLEQARFDLVLLDLELPGGDGLDVLRGLRARGERVPVVIMTGGRTETEQRVEGLDAGADDYLPKPFEFSELVARVRAVLRRASGGRTLHFKVGDLEVDVAARRVSRAGRELDLTQREFEMLEYLARHEGRTVTRGMMARDVWKEPNRATPLDNVVDVHVSRLRRKLDAESGQPLLHTVWGKGFTLESRE